MQGRPWAMDIKFGHRPDDEVLFVDQNNGFGFIWHAIFRPHVIRDSSKSHVFWRVVDGDSTGFFVMIWPSGRNSDPGELP